MVLSHQANSLLNTALSQIVQKVFVARSEEFDVFVFENETENLGDIVNKVMKNSQVPIKMIKVQNQEPIIKINQSAILFFKTVNSFQAFSNQALLYNEYPKNIQFFIYIEDHSNFASIFNTTSLFLVHSSFIYGNLWGEFFYLIIVDTISASFCRQKRSVVINSFSKKTQKWHNSKFFRNMIYDFKGCKLTIAVSVPDPLIFEEKIGTVTNGYGTLLIHEIANQLNFQCNIVGITKYETNRYGADTDEWDVFIYTSSLRQTSILKERPWLLLKQAKKFPSYATFPFTCVDTVVLVSKPELYSQFEKNILPFQYEVWILLISTLVFAAVVITLMKFTARSKQQFVFGSKVQTPGLNLL